MEYAGLIAGLGNPGGRYAGTRHNCGFMFIDQLLELCRREGSIEDLNGKKFNSMLWSIALPEIKGRWLAAKPQTFMNDSGRAIRPLLAWHNLPPQKLVVVQDELDIPPGELRFKFGGGLAGHNGLASIAQEVGSRDFYRLRIGIGKPANKSDVINWVLARPSQQDFEKIKSSLPFALDSFFIFTTDGLQSAAAMARAAGEL